VTKSCPEVAQYFQCKICDYLTCKKSSFDKHLLTAKHVKLTLANTLHTKKLLVCNICNKQYNSRNGLWKHQKSCNLLNYDDENEKNKKLNNEEPIDKHMELIMMLVKENSELKTMMMEVIKNGTHNTTNNNSHNKSFNLQFFLNETCKDAMNITDFVDSIQLQLSDLENVGRLGYVDGISKIIINKLNDLDETKRPIHCTDTKREVLYIKDADKWEKENNENEKVRKAIKRIAHKNCKLLPEFREKHPDCNKSESRYSDQYNKMIVEAMGGQGDNNKEKEDKIIKNISKEVIINKNS
jgi:hypothetical protein